jgi:hypothetical protein
VTPGARTEEAAAAAARTEEEEVAVAVARAVAGEPVAHREVVEPGALACSRRNLLGSDSALCHLPSLGVGKAQSFDVST